MATGTWTTTPTEDAAILSLGNDKTVPEFVNRHLRHQIDFAVSQHTATTGALALDAYAAATPEDRAAVDAILAKTRKG